MEDSEKQATGKMQEFWDLMADLRVKEELWQLKEEKRIDDWWESLSNQEQMDAFYSVVKRIYQGDVKDRGTYRYVLYDVFGFGPEAYGMGMDCGYMALHNYIFEGVEKDDQTV